MNLQAMFAQIIDRCGFEQHPSPYTMAQLVRTVLDDAGWQVSPVFMPDGVGTYAICVAAPDGYLYRLTVTVEDDKCAN